jgi:hypothetical protein
LFLIAVVKDSLAVWLLVRAFVLAAFASVKIVVALAFWSLVRLSKVASRFTLISMRCSAVGGVPPPPGLCPNASIAESAAVASTPVIFVILLNEPPQC